MGTKRKIEMKMRDTKEQRSVTFSKRHKGLFKKADELHSLTGASTAVLAFTPAGKPFTHGDPSFDDTITRYFLSIGEIPDQGRSWAEVVISPGERHDEDRFGFELRAWLDGINVEGCCDLEELVATKKKLEEIKLHIISKMENDFVSSFLA